MHIDILTQMMLMQKPQYFVTKKYEQHASLLQRIVNVTKAASNNNVSQKMQKS